jgi:hypothetical protein
VTKPRQPAPSPCGEPRREERPLPAPPARRRQRAAEPEPPAALSDADRPGRDRLGTVEAEEDTPPRPPHERRPPGRERSRQAEARHEDRPERGGVRRRHLAHHERRPRREGRRVAADELHPGTRMRLEPALRGKAEECRRLRRRLQHPPGHALRVEAGDGLVELGRVRRRARAEAEDAVEDHRREARADQLQPVRPDREGLDPEGHAHRFRRGRPEVAIGRGLRRLELPHLAPAHRTPA